MGSLNLINYRKKIFDKIDPLKSWLYYNTGLNLMIIINEVLEQYKTPLEQSEIDDFNKGIDILRKSSMIQYDIDKILEKKLPGGITSVKLVKKSDGSYSYLNKLNTNYTALANLLTDMIVKSIEINREKGLGFYEKLIQDPQKALLSIQKFLKRLILNYFPTLESLEVYSKYIMKSSEIGEFSEKKVADFLQRLGYTILYQGGNGNFIDMIFGCDIICQKEDEIGDLYSGIKTIQVKSYLPKMDDLKYYKVDWVSYGYNNVNFFDLKTKTPIIIK